MSPQAKLFAGLGLCGCSITQTVELVADNDIERICVEPNPGVLMDGFESAVCELIEE
ncbi:MULTISPECIES: hypothetical protein [unclassified Guyparkeria]|uniref:hypothetical protein n=1 Tax=unclassified Guyparkeria TaxID=2626246 RepID=UPI001E3A4ED0|nr:MULTISPECIES: hypothetical protein [unclassified Guyparkeria]